MYYYYYYSHQPFGFIDFKSISSYCTVELGYQLSLTYKIQTNGSSVLSSVLLDMFLSLGFNIRGCKFNFQRHETFGCFHAIRWTCLIRLLQ